MKRRVGVQAVLLLLVAAMAVAVGWMVTGGRGEPGLPGPAGPSVPVASDPPRVEPAGDAPPTGPPGVAAVATKDAAPSTGAAPASATAPVASLAPAAPAPELAAPGPGSPPAGEVLEGVVRAPGGAPLAGARVALMALPAELLAQVPREARAMVLAQWRQQGLSGALVARSAGQTGPDGVFRLARPTDPDLTELWLRVEHPGHPTALSDPFPPARPLPGLWVEMLPGARGEVVVRGPDGALLADCWVELVVGPGSAPVPGGPLRFHVPGGSPGQPHLAGGEQGRVAVGPLCAGKYPLRVGAPGWRIVRRELLLPGGPLEVVLERGLEVRGRVVDPDGQPIVGAQVWAARERDGEATAPSESGVDGSFVLSGLDAGRYSLGAQAPGFVRRDGGPGGGGVMAEAGGEPVDVVLSRLVPVSGTVVLAGGGEPAGEGVRVEARHRQRRDWVVGQATTGADGSFRFAGLEPGRYALVAQGRGLATLRPLLITVGPGAAEPLRVEVARGGEVEVTVVDRDGRPLAGAEVRALDEREAMSFGMPLEGPAAEPQLRSDASGRASLELGPGSWVLLVDHPDHAPRRVPAVVGRTRLALRVQLAAPGAIRGRVLGKDGAPLASAPLLLMGSDGPAGFQMGATDPDGRFAIERLAPGTYQLNLMPMDGGSAGVQQIQPLQTVTLAEGQVWERDLRLGGDATAGRVEGLILRAGQPAEGVRVASFREGRGLSDGYGFVTSDAEGRFTIPDLVPGIWRLTTDGAEARVEVRSGATARVELRLSQASVAGEVHDPDGAPVAEATVHLVPVAAGAGAHAFARLSAVDERQLVADAPGRFEFSPVLPGRYRLVARAPGLACLGSELEVTAAGARPGPLQLAPAGTLEVTVRGSDGLPLAPARLHLFHRDLALDPAMLDRGAPDSFEGTGVDADGVARFTELLPGTYVVRARSDGASALAEGVVVGPGATAQVTLVLTPTASLEVLGPPGAALHLLLAASGAPALPLDMQSILSGGPRVGPEGQVLVSGLPATELTVTGETAEGRPLRGGTVRLQPGGAGQVRLESP